MTLAAFLAEAIRSLLVAISPVGTTLPGTAIWVAATLPAVVFLNEALRTLAEARLLSLGRTRTCYPSLKTIIDQTFGGLHTPLGLKIAAT